MITLSRKMRREQKKSENPKVQAENEIITIASWV
jgi:hypothetical protein